MEFLDYGGSEPVSLASVKALPGNFLELPFQGIHCSLKRETLTFVSLLSPLRIVQECNCSTQVHKASPLGINLLGTCSGMEI